MNAGDQPLFLNFGDTSCCYYWIASILAFDCEIDATRLQRSLTELVQSRPILGARLLQNPEGKYFFGYNNEAIQIPFKVTSQPQASIADLPGKFARRKISDAEPDNSIVPDLIPQMQPHLLLAGEEALFKLQLTHVQDGSVLGLAISHGLTDYEGIGYAMADLAHLYQGHQAKARTDSRLGLALAALRFTGTLPQGPAPDQDIIAKLPSWVVPKNYQECVSTGRYDLLSCTAADRAVGEYHSASVLHVPRSCIERLRAQVLASKAAKEGGISVISANDIMASLLWLIREVGNGNDLQHGLQKSLLNAVDFRKNCPDPDVISENYFGHAVGGSFCMPPEMQTTSPESAVAPATNGVTHNQKGQLQNPSDDHLMALIAAAACEVRKGLQSLRNDPNSLSMQAASFLQYLDQSVMAALDSPEFMPTRDAALWVSSWKNMAIENVDFGSGKAKVHLGCVMPASQRAVNVCAGPNGDGLMCIIRLSRDGLARVQQSKLLDRIAPEAVLLV